MAQTVSLWGATYSSVPSITVPGGNGTVSFIDVTDTTASAADVAQGKDFYLASGTKAVGTLAFQTIYTGTSTPSSSIGSNGDIYIKTS